MQYKFSIQNDKLICYDTVIPRTGNVNTYQCTFNINTNIKGLRWFCVFKQNDTAIAVPIIENSCNIPLEVLVNEGELNIGCYATNGNADDFKRKTTNWLTFRTTTGAYTEATEPEIPTPDLWETLVLKTVPYIGANNNWFVYDLTQGCYVDTEVNASGAGSGEGPTVTIDQKFNPESENAQSGKAVAEALDTIKLPTNMSELENDSGYVKNTDYATETVGGVVKVKNFTEGLLIKNNGTLSVYGAEKPVIAAKQSRSYPITPVNLEYAVEVCTNQDSKSELTEAQLKLPPSTQYLKDVVGGIETALDNIIAIQNELIGGDSE